MPKWIVPFRCNNLADYIPDVDPTLRVCGVVTVDRETSTEAYWAAREKIADDMPYKLSAELEMTEDARIQVEVLPPIRYRWWSGWFWKRFYS